MLDAFRQLVKEGRECLAPAGEVGCAEAIDKHNERTGGTRWSLLRPWQSSTVGVGRVTGGKHHGIGRGGARWPAGDIRGITQPAQPVNDRWRGKLGGTESFNDVSAHGFAGFFKTGQNLISQGESAEDIFRDHRAAGDHAVAIQPGFALGSRARRGIVRRRDGQRPAAIHIRRGGVRALGLGERGASHAQAGALRAALLLMRAAPRPVRGKPSADRCKRIGADKAHLY